MPESSPIGVRPLAEAPDELVIDLTRVERRRRLRSSPVRGVVVSTPDPRPAPTPALLERALDTVTEMVLVADPSGRVRYANRSARENLVWAEPGCWCELADDLIGGVASLDMWTALETSDNWLGERTAAGHGGTTLSLEITVHAQRASTGEIHTLTIVAEDRAEHVALERALTHQVTHDALTGLTNRQHLLLQLDRVLADPARPGVLVLIDIDEFRTVTNSLGHDTGNRVLMGFASRLRRTFGPGSLLARVGGDEFVVYCPGPHDVDALARRIHDLTAVPLRADQDDVHLSVVVGIAVVEDHDRPRNGAELLRRADAALHAAKKRGRGGHGVFDPADAAAAKDRLTTARELRRALREQELTVHFQPKISLATGAIIGAEALIRWQLPDGSMRSPATFLDVAENTGLIIPMGRVVLEQACAAAARIGQRFPEHADLEMAVNLSVRQLDHPDFVQELAEVVCGSGVDPTRLELEITESMVMDDIEASTEMLRQLKRLGVRIAIDDFGTGHSSLRYLQRLPVDVLKIDRSFVSGLTDGDGSQAAIVTAVIHLAQALKLTTVAEGVETDDQLAALRSLRCDAAQGYLMGRPLPEDEFLALIGACPVW